MTRKEPSGLNSRVCPLQSCKPSHTVGKGSVPWEQATGHHRDEVHVIGKGKMMKSLRANQILLENRGGGLREGIVDSCTTNFQLPSAPVACGAAPLWSGSSPLHPPPGACSAPAGTRSARLYLAVSLPTPESYC